MLAKMLNQQCHNLDLMHLNLTNTHANDACLYDYYKLFVRYKQTCVAVRTVMLEGASSHQTAQQDRNAQVYSCVVQVDQSMALASRPAISPSLANAGQVWAEYFRIQNAMDIGKHCATFGNHQCRAPGNPIPHRNPPAHHQSTFRACVAPSQDTGVEWREKSTRSKRAGSQLEVDTQIKTAELSSWLPMPSVHQCCAASA